MRNKKVKTKEGRLKENNMLYRVGEKIRIHDRENLASSGLSVRNRRAIKHLAGKTFKIVAINGFIAMYVLENTSTPVGDNAIAHMVI